MLNDKTTLQDLSIFTQAEGDVFSLINHTTTTAGRDALRKHINNPPQTVEHLRQMQAVIRWWAAHPDLWTTTISNGTLVLLEKFFDSADGVTSPPTGLSLVLGSFFQKILNRNQYTFIRFSLTHLTDLLLGCTELAALLKSEQELPVLLAKELQRMADELHNPLVGELLRITPQTSYSVLIRLSFRARRELKSAAYRLQEYYARMDAWQAMGRATTLHHWAFPELTDSLPVVFAAEGLYHPLVQKPVGYNISFDEHRRFLLLTGANMSGKTTFMRALGVGALLAQLGVGVPAKSMRISFLQGVITNMHVVDNILRGESYFFAEVQRMKETAQRLTGDGPYLVLMDELFIGTNVHDAYECTRAVVDGLLGHPHHIMILSTHLHEVAHHFAERKDMLFAYFVTETAPNGTFRFTYELRAGISNDRIGYRILQQEGVIDLLTRKKH